MNEEHLALEAERLMKDAVLLEAMKRARVEWIERLVAENPEDFVKIAETQANIRALDSLTDNLRRFIVAQAEY